MAPEKGSDVADWESEVDDVFVPAVQRASFTKAQGGLPTTAAQGPGSHGVARRMSSLGSLHPHAGHTSWPIATGHLITAIIGAGVLGLPNAVAWLGWVAGLVCVCVFYAITLWTCTMLTDCYHVKGKRHTRYKWAVLHIMGPKHSVLLSLCQHVNMVLTTIGYHIAAADSMHYIAKLACKSMGRTECPLPGQWQHTIIFGALQLIMSQLPNLESVWWVSAIGALMSIGYSLLAVVLGASQASNHEGTLGGRVALTQDKIFGIFNSLGNIGFAYSSAIVLLEIQDTLREPPRAAVSMKKTVMAGLGTTFFFYLLVVVLGYMALGNAVPDNVLLGFHQSPPWVNMLANAMVLVHMVSAYQLFAQPVFQTIEDTIIRFVPRLAFAPRSHELPLRLGYRSVYVAFTTFVASLLPFFGAFTGLVGAVTFFPTAVAYPILMYMRITPDIPPARRALMWAVFGGMGLVALVATAGSLESIVHTASSFKLFGGRDG